MALFAAAVAMFPLDNVSTEYVVTSEDSDIPLSVTNEVSVNAPPPAPGASNSLVCASTVAAVLQPMMPATGRLLPSPGVCSFFLRNEPKPDEPDSMEESSRCRDAGGAGRLDDDVDGCRLLEAVGTLTTVPMASSLDMSFWLEEGLKEYDKLLV